MKNKKIKWSLISILPIAVASTTIATAVHFVTKNNNQNNQDQNNLFTVLNNETTQQLPPPKQTSVQPDLTSTIYGAKTSIGYDAFEGDIDTDLLSILNLEETDATSRIVNGVKVTRPIIGGPVDFKIQKTTTSEKFDPYDWGYQIYDALDNNVEVTFENIDNIDLSTTGQHTFRIVAKNKYKLKTTREFTIHIVEEADFKAQTTFKYAPYVMNGDNKLARDLGNELGAAMDWQLLIPYEFAENERIKIKQTNDNARGGSKNIPRIFKGPTDNSFKDRAGRGRVTGLPVFNNGAAFRHREVTQPKGNDDWLIFKAMYLANSAREPDVTDAELPIYEIQIIGEDDQPVQLGDRKKISQFIHLDKSDNNERERKFIEKWKREDGGAYVRNRATSFILPKQDMLVHYRQEHTGSGNNKNYNIEIRPEILREANVNVLKMQNYYKQLRGLYSGVAKGKESVYYNTSALSLGWRGSSSGASAVANVYLAFWLETGNFWMRGFWTNGSGNGDLITDLYKHEYGHVFQNEHLIGGNGDGGISLTELTNIFNFIYMDWQEAYKKKFKEYENDSSLTNEQKIEKAFREAWRDLRYFASFSTTRHNPLLSVYNDNVISNPELYKRFFSRDHFWDYFDMRHTIFPKVFARFGWEALTYMFENFYKIRNGTRLSPFLFSRSSNIDLMVYLMSEFAKVDLTNFFEHYGFKTTNEVKNAIIKKGWVKYDMVNMLGNTSAKVNEIIAQNQDQRVYYQTSLIKSDEVNDNSRSASISVLIKSDDLPHITNKIVYLLQAKQKSDGSYEQTIVGSQLINNNVLTFDNLNAGMYTILLPSYGEGDRLKDAEHLFSTLMIAQDQTLVAEFRNTDFPSYRTKAFKWPGDGNNRSNIVNAKREINARASELLKNLKESVLPISKFQDHFKYDLTLLKMYADRIKGWNEPSTLVDEIDRYFENIKEVKFVWDNTNLVNQTVALNTDFASILANINFKLSDDSRTRSVNFKDILYTNLPFDSQSRVNQRGRYTIRVIDENKQINTVNIEVR